MANPCFGRDEPFAAAMDKKLRQLAEFDEAGAIGRRMTSAADVRDALFELAIEVRNLRLALEPSSSPIVHGDEAVRAFRHLQEQR